MRVMVLPQGKVQRFLLDSSQDRQTYSANSAATSSAPSPSN